MRFPDNPFWDFSLAVYGSRGVADACLALQERHGVDVNLLLFCAWQGREVGRRLDAPEIAALQARVAAWHDTVVRHLRSLRRALKSPPPEAPPELAQDLRRQIQKVEIDAEHIEQLILADALPAADGPAPSDAEGAAAAAHNIDGYFALLGVKADDADRAAVRALLAAVFSDGDADAAMAAL